MHDHIDENSEARGHAGARVWPSIVRKMTVKTLGGLDNQPRYNLPLAREATVLQYRDLVEAPGANLIRVGTSIRDTFFGEGDRDYLAGMGGDDFLSGGDGDDFLISGNTTRQGSYIGGSGNDVIIDGVSPVLQLYYTGMPTSYAITVAVDGGIGDDIIVGLGAVNAGAGNDIIFARGTAAVHAGDGNDTIFVSGNYVSGISGEGGNDRLIFAGAGAASVGFGAWSDTGQDTAVIYGDFAGNVEIAGIGPGDIVEFNGVSGITSVASIQSRMYWSGWDLIIVVDANTTVSIRQPDITNIQFRIGGTDVAGIFATTQARVDALSVATRTQVGDEGSQILNGSAADDFIYGYGGSDAIYGGLANDYLAGGTGNDGLFGGQGNDQLFGGQGDDDLLGGAGADRLTGGEGADRLTGGAGADVLDGGNGVDIVFYDAAVGVDMNTPSAGWGDASGDTFVSIEVVSGSAFNDDLRGNMLSNELRGGRGDDVLYGRGGDDLLIGGAGSDQLYGGAGADTFRFNSGMGAETVHDFATSGGDVLNILVGSAADSFAEVMTFASQQGSNTVFNFGGGDTITLVNVALANLSSDDFRFIA